MRINNQNLNIPGLQINQHFRLIFDKSDIGSNQLFVPDGLLAVIYLHKGTFTLSSEQYVHTHTGPDLLFTIYLNSQTVIPHSECEVYGLTLYPNLGGNLSGELKYIHDRFISYKDISPAKADMLLEMLSHQTDPIAIQSILQEHSYSPLRSENSDSSSAKRVNDVLNHIRANATNLAVSDLGELSNASLRTLQKDFKDHLGTSIKEYINLYKFNTFRKALHAGLHEKLGDLAFDMGYYDQSHLIRHFKKYTGLSPRSYITEHSGMDMARTFYHQL